MWSLTTCRACGTHTFKSGADIAHHRRSCKRIGKTNAQTRVLEAVGETAHRYGFNALPPWTRTPAREAQMQRHQDVEISATGEIQDNNRVDLLTTSYDTVTSATTLGEARPAMATATATTTRVSRPRLPHNLPRPPQQHYRQQQQQQQRMQTMTMTRMFGLQLLLLLPLLHNGNK